VSVRDLWETVAAAPEDDELLLVVADAFEERGDPLRAELLRVQLAISRADPYAVATLDLRWRERALLWGEGGRWRAELPRWEDARLEGFERGFPAWLRVRDPQALLRLLPELPPGVTGLRLASLGEPGELEALPGLPWLRRLELEPQIAVDRLRELLDSPLVHPGLSALSLPNQSLGDADIAWLADSPALCGLRALRLRDNHVGAAGMQTIAASPHLRGLVDLALGTFAFGNVAYFGMQGMQSLLGWQAFSRLQVLDLSRQELDADSAAALLQSDGALRELDLSENALTGLGPLTRGEIRLQRLRVTHCELYDDDLQRLLQSPALSAARSLDLGVNRLSPALAQRLAAAPCWAGLQSLSMQGVPLHRRLAPFVQSPVGPADLELGKCGLDESDVAELARAPWFAQLRSLRLLANPLRARKAQMGLLARASRLRSLRLGPEGHSALAGLPPTLLELQAPAISEDLARCALPELLSLELASTPVDLASLRRLASAPWLPHLVELGLRECRLPAGSLTTLLSGNLASLRILRLALNPLGEELSLLLGTPALAHLEHLSLDPRGVPRAQQARLHQALPGLRQLVWQAERVGFSAEDLVWPSDWR
jgi:uncharacterized protein (TIGR02996 family)